MEKWKYLVLPTEGEGKYEGVIESINYSSQYIFEFGTTKWSDFYQIRRKEGWVLVTADEIDRSRSSLSDRERVLKKLYSDSTHTITTNKYEELQVQLECLTSCAGAYWEAIHEDFAEIYVSGNISYKTYPDCVRCYNKLGELGWELVFIKNLTGAGLYYEEVSPRMAFFRRKN